jgi:hypothetical protein
MIAEQMRIEGQECRRQEAELTKDNVKSKPHRKKSGARGASKTAGGTHKLQSQVACIGKRSPIKFSCGIDDNEALAIEEPLDERERRG